MAESESESEPRPSTSGLRRSTRRHNPPLRYREDGSDVSDTDLPALQDLFDEPHDDDPDYRPDSPTDVTGAAAVATPLTPAVSITLQNLTPAQVDDLVAQVRTGVYNA